MLGSFAPLLQQQTSSPLSLLVPLILMVGVFYFLLIRPQQRRQRAQRELMRDLAVGDEVVTIGGMYGIVREVEEDSVTIEPAPGVEIRFLKSAIARRLVTEDDEQEASEEEEAGDQT